MSTPEDAVLAYWKEHREQLRQSEKQRAVLTNYLLAVAAAVSGLIVQQRFSPRTLPLSVLVVLIGLYGAVAVAKYHERADYHLSQARALTKALIDVGGLARHDALLDDFRERHCRKYPRLHRLRVNWLWIGLHLGIAAYGVGLLIVTLVLL